MSGPIVTPSSSPCPSTSPPSSGSSREMSSCLTALCTSTRFVATHACPALRSLEAASARAATSRSASSNTTNGAFPPSSSASFLTVGAHCAKSLRPTAVEPVKDKRRTRASIHMAAPTSGELAREQGRTLNTPGGTPASSASCSSASAESGVASAGLTTAVQPAASAGATLRVIIALGKFHGVMAATTPIGCLSTSSRRSADGACKISPFTRRASSANQRTNELP
mmetsp:Transcript_20951/g.65136  ORF Transcript_20951/g.65136 Transcript_20951/m.65136 type:complete len:225 (-) Transcript_20951:391-1065(-)